MKLKGCIDEDFTNYKKPCMFLIFPYCSFKCDKENGNQYCQNWSLVKQPNIEISSNYVVKRYLSNPITKSIVFGGLEPLDSWDDLYELIQAFRLKTNDDIVIYTGYNKNEISDKIILLKYYKNIVIKFGRYKPNQELHYDEVLGIELASDNQYAERIS